MDPKGTVVIRYQISWETYWKGASKTFFSFLFRAVPAVYASFQPRGQIGVVAAGWHHRTAMPDLSCICGLQHSSWQLRILSPLSEAGIEPASSWILVCVSAEPWWEILNICFILPFGSIYLFSGNKLQSCSVFLFMYVFFLLGPHLCYMEALGLGVESELQLPAYTSATTTPDPNCIWDLQCSLWQCQIFSPLSKARVKPGSSWILVRPLTRWATMGTLQSCSV